VDPRRNSHCAYCGAAFDAVAVWPRTCTSCQQTSWLNPTPVGVLLIPIETRPGNAGLLVIRRAIAPGLGQLALPGGYLVVGESWQLGTVREVREETGLELDPAGVRLHAVTSTPNGNELLIFGSVDALDAGELDGFRPTDETDAVQVITRPETLAFPLHTAVVKDWFRTAAPGTDGARA